MGGAVIQTDIVVSSSKDLTERPDKTDPGGF
jgi:hypothetical protein